MKALEPATEEKEEDVVTVRMADITGDGTADVRLENERLYIEAKGDQLQNPWALTAAGWQGGSNLTGPIKTKPHSPVSQTGKEVAQFQKVRSFGVTYDGNRLGAYQLTRQYEYEQQGVVVVIRWEVYLPAGEQLVFLQLQLQNIDDRPIVLDHDHGDIHDGIIVLKNTRLLGRGQKKSDYRFYLPQSGIHTYRRQPTFKTFVPSRFATHFDADVGVTYGYLSGSTGPKMWVTMKNGLDFLTNEFRLGASQKLTYRCVVAFHQGGESAPSQGHKLMARAQRLIG